MRNRRTVVLVFLLVAVLAIGVGYAAIQDALDIQGTVEMQATTAEKALDKDVYFTRVIDKGDDPESDVKTKGFTANINTNNNDKAQFSVYGHTEVGQVIEITYEVTNTGENANQTAVVTTNITTNSQSEYFNVTTSWDNEVVTLAPEATETITVYIELIKAPTSYVNSSVVIELSAVAE